MRILTNSRMLDNIICFIIFQVEVEVDNLLGYMFSEGVNPTGHGENTQYIINRRSKSS